MCVILSNLNRVGVGGGFTDTVSENCVNGHIGFFYGHGSLSAYAIFFFSNGQFPLSGAPTGNHGSRIYRTKYQVQDENQRPL